MSCARSRSLAVVLQLIVERDCRDVEAARTALVEIEEQRTIR